MILEGGVSRRLSRSGRLAVVLAGALALAVFPRLTGSEAPAEEKAREIRPAAPELKGKRVDVAAGKVAALEFLKFLADYTGLPVR